MNLTPITEFKAHPRHAQGVAFSPDGGEIVTTGMDAVARVWSASDFSLLRTLEAHEKSVNAIAISPDGETAVTASSDRTAIVWDYRRAEAIRTLTGFRNTLAAAKFSPDGRIAAVSSYDGRIGIWERESGAFRVFRSHPRHVTSLSFSPDGECLAASGIGNIIKIWNPRDGAREPTAEIEASPQAAAVGCLFLADGGLLIHAYEGEIQTRAAADYAPLAAARTPDGATLNSAAQLGARPLIFCSLAGGVALIDLTDLSVAARAETGIKGMYGVCASPDAAQTAAVGADGKCRVWGIGG